MNPWLIGGGIAAVIALFAVANGGTSASQDQMVFRDYQWTTPLPTYAGPGGDNANPLAQQLPPPPNAGSAPGIWVPFPGGQYVPGVTSKKTTAMQPFTVFHNIPAGITIWAWRPKAGVTTAGTANITKLNGYWVSWVAWEVATTPAYAQAHGMDPSPHGQPASTSNPSFHYSVSIPPPPGETAATGKWDMWAPGYVVWITPSNEHQAAALASTASYLPGQAPMPLAPSAPVAPTAPSPTPIAVTPPAAPAPAGG